MTAAPSTTLASEYVERAATKLEAERKARVEHRRVVDQDVLVGLTLLGLDRDTAEYVLFAINAGDVPHTWVHY